MENLQGKLISAGFGITAKKIEMKRAILFLLAAAMLLEERANAEALRRAEIGLGDAMADFSLYDTKRRLRSCRDYEDAKALVLIFVSTECPLANLYLPTLKALHQSYEGRGVQFLLINSDAGDSFNRVAGHAWENEIPFPVLKDFDQSVGAALGAKRTPQAFVLDSGRALRYRGRIDDQYTVTHRRLAPASEELKNALDNLLAGEPIEEPETTPSGCLIDYSGNPYANAALNYAEHIAPIVDSRCLECHQRGRVGQISFSNYRQLKRFSKTIREVVLEERMPPWHADPRYGRFANNRSLSGKERLQLLAWIDQGCREGEPQSATAEKKIVDSTQWVIGEPDLVLSMPMEQKVPASGVVDYQYFTVDPGFAEEVWVQAAEAQPGNPEVVHHIIAYILSPGKEIFARDGETAILVGWAPGDMPSVHPPGTARRIPAGAKLRMELHYTPNGREAVDRSRIGIRFAKSPPKREVRTNIMWQRQLLVPSESSWHAETATYQFQNDARILSLMPHMHLRGVAAKYLLVQPDGSEEILLSVPYYDFNWQSIYRFQEPIVAAKGAKLTMTGVWDNSADNPNNPDPRREVPWGQQTWDEMLNGWMNFVYEKPNPPRELTAETHLQQSEEESSNNKSVLLGRQP